MSSWRWVDAECSKCGVTFDKYDVGDELEASFDELCPDCYDEWVDGELYEKELAHG